MQRSLFETEAPARAPEPAQPPTPACQETALPGAAERRQANEIALAEVRSRAVVCTRCPLSQTRTNVVFGEGNPAAPLVLVGEGPGENEDATGRPFVGRAGKLLDDVLRRAGMTREHVYICNTIKCRAADMVAGRWRNRAPTGDEISACNPWLHEQLSILRPTVLVCVGAPSAGTLIRRPFPISTQRGRWFTDCTYAPWAMAILHPAYVLRQHGATFDAWVEQMVDDLNRARLKVAEVRKQARETAAPPQQLSLFGEG